VQYCSPFTKHTIYLKGKPKFNSSCLIEALYPLTFISTIRPTQPLLTTSTLCLLGFDCSRFFQIPRITENMQYFSFCAWLISRTITFYKSNHAATNDTCSFLRLSIFYCVCIYIYFSPSFHLMVNTLVDLLFGLLRIMLQYT
jgi:hypothetical protein